MKRLAVLASGSGTILEAMSAAGVAVELVVVDRPCRALEVASGAGVDGEVIERLSFGADFDRVAYTERLVKVLAGRDVDRLGKERRVARPEDPVGDLHGGVELKQAVRAILSGHRPHAVEQRIDPRIEERLQVREDA